MVMAEAAIAKIEHEHLFFHLFAARLPGVHIGDLIRECLSEHGGAEQFNGFFLAHAHLQLLNGLYRDDIALLHIGPV